MNKTDRIQLILSLINKKNDGLFVEVKAVKAPPDPMLMKTAKNPDKKKPKKKPKKKQIEQIEQIEQINMMAGGGLAATDDTKDEPVISRQRRDVLTGVDCLELHLVGEDW